MNKEKTINKKKIKPGRPKREVEYQKFSCELPYELATEVRAYCHKQGLILNNFTKDALEEKMSKIKGDK